MQVYSDGNSRVLNGKFPKRFKLLQDGIEIPFLRTGASSIRIVGNIPVGNLDIEEVIVKDSLSNNTTKKPNLQNQSNFSMFSIIDKSDIDRIDVLNKKMVIRQQKLNENLVGLKTKIDKTNETILEVAKVFDKEIQADRESLIKVSESFTSSLDETGNILSNKIYTHEMAKNPHKITKATIGLERVDNTSDDEKPVSKQTKEALDKKADKSEIYDIIKKIDEVGKKNEILSQSVKNTNFYGGVGGNESISGGKKGQVLTKNSSKDGDYSWKYSTGSLNVDGGHADTIYTSEQIINGGKA